MIASAGYIRDLRAPSALSVDDKKRIASLTLMRARQDLARYYGRHITAPDLRPKVPLTEPEATKALADMMRYFPRPVLRSPPAYPLSPTEFFDAFEERP